MNLIWTQAKELLFLLLVILSIAYYVNSCIVASISIILICFLYYFFRNPKTPTTKQSNKIVSPSYGQIKKIIELPTYHKIIIYLSPFDIHTQYAPITGKIVNQQYIKGKFHPAFLFKKSHLNERLIHTIKSRLGNIYVTQIAGIIARRIVSMKKIGEDVDSGTLLGLIKFSSRVDLVIPKTLQLKCQVGQKVIGGRTTLATGYKLF